MNIQLNAHIPRSLCCAIKLEFHFLRNICLVNPKQFLLTGAIEKNRYNNSLSSMI